MSPSSDREYLQGRLEATSAAAMREFLQYRSLAPASAGTLEAQATRILKYLDEAKLALSDVHGFLLDFYESNAKRVLLFDCAPADDQLSVLANLENQRISPTVNDLKLSATSPTLSYSQVTADFVRIVWVEQQRWYKIVSKSTGETELQIAVKVIVAHYLRRSQRLYMLYDPHDSNTNHESLEDYYSYYSDRAVALLSVGITPVPLHDWVASLFAPNHPLCEPLGQRGQNDRTSFSIHSRGKKSLQGAEEYEALLKAVKSFQGGEFSWKSGIQPSAAGLLPLVRPVSTLIDCRASMVKFQQHTLRNEIDYVLAHAP